MKQEDSIIRCEVTVGTPSQQQKQEPQQQQQPQDALWLAAQLTDFVEATGSQEEAREDTADHTAASDQVRPFGAQGSPDQLAVLDALVRLTALALQQEGAGLRRSEPVGDSTRAGEPVSRCRSEAGVQTRAM